MTTFKVGQMTDSHIYGGDGVTDEKSLMLRENYYRSCIKEVAAHGVELIIHTGDLVNADRGKPYHERFKKLLDEVSAELNIPVWVCRGNHEASHVISDADYRVIWGPSTWLQEHKGWYFLGVDRFWKTYNHGGHQYAMSPETFDEIDELLAQVPDGAPLVTMLHDNPVGISDFWHGEEFLYRIKTKNIKFLLFGHVQGNWISTYKGIPHYTVVGERQCFDSSPLTYNIITCDSGGGHVCDFYPYLTNTPEKGPERKFVSGAQKVKATSDWLGFRGPMGTRATHDELPSKTPALAWTTQLPGGLSIGAPTLSDGKLFLGTKTRGRFEQCAALALDPESGKTIWHTTLDGSAEGGVVLNGNKGYAGTTAGSIFCVDLDYGQIDWKWRSCENIPIACPLAYDPEEDTVHAGANFEMYAVNGSTGATLWRTTTTVNGCGYFTGGHAGPVIGSDRVFHRRPYGAGNNDNRFIVSVDKRTGLAPQKTPVEYTDQAMMRHTSPIIHRGYLIAVGHGLWVSGESANLQSEPYIWHEHTQGGATPAAMDNDIVVSYHSEIVAYDLLNYGRVKWIVPHEPALLHFGGGEGSKFLSNYGEYPTNGTFSSPLICGDKLLVCDTAGLCRCLRMKDGTELWRLDLGEPILCAPIVSGNTLFIGDYQGKMYAFSW